jgi:hypothetical protein
MATERLGKKGYFKNVCEARGEEAFCYISPHGLKFQFYPTDSYNQEA